MRFECMKKTKIQQPKDAKRGVQKIKLWTLLLTGLLVFAAGLRFGVFLPQIINFAKIKGPEFLEKVLRFFSPVQENVSIPQSNDWVSIFVIVVFYILLFCIIHPFLPKKEQSLKEIFKEFTVENLVALPTQREVAIFIYLSLATVSTYMAYVENVKIVNICSFFICVLILGIIKYVVNILKEICDKRNSEDYVFFEQNKKKILTITTIIASFVIGAPFIIPDFLGFTIPQFVVLKNMGEYYAAILSLTFISISVMSALSDKTVVIYWENIAERKLIKPIFASFAAYTFYSIGAAICAGICFIVNNSTAFFVFGVLNVATIIALTFTMVDVYYDRGSKKVKLAKELQEDAEDYLWDFFDKHVAEKSNEEEIIEHYQNKETGKPYTKQEIKDKQVGSQRYKEKMMLLRQNIKCAKEKHDLDYLQEVYDLYQKNIYCFNTLDGIEISKLLFTDCDEECWSLVIRSISNLADEKIKNQNRKKDPFINGYYGKDAKWNQDENMWIALTRTPYLKKALNPSDREILDRAEFNDLMLPVVKRVVAIYNDMVTHLNLSKQKNYDYLEATLKFSFISIKTEQGNEPDKKQIFEVFDEMFEMMVPIECITTHIMRMLAAIIKYAQNDERDTIARIFIDLPMPYWYTQKESEEEDCVKYLISDEYMQDLWRDVFAQ